MLEETGPGVPKKKTELIKAWFKGVDAKQDKFICRPVIGYTRGPFPRFSKGAVYKLKVFGVGVLEERGRRNRWERMKPEVQDRCECLLGLVCWCLYLIFVMCLSLTCRVMAKANVAMHTKLKKAKKEEAQVTLTVTLTLTLTLTLTQTLTLTLFLGDTKIGRA